MWRKTKRWLYLIHRWMGIAGCLLIAMWFGSGLVMMYVGFPALTDAERLAALPTIDASRVVVGPDAAMQAAGLDQYPRSLRLEMAGDLPVYRMIDGKGQPHTVSAVDGRVIDHVDADTARATAQRFAGKPARWLETAERDQWTVPNGLNAWRPLHRIAIDDDAGTELYVSAKTGEVMRDTHRAERLWNWLGSVPHWLYFTPIRKDPPLWRQVVLWTSGPCAVVAITGIWIGWLRLRVRRRFAHGSMAGASPYHGWMAWHHVAGLIGSLFLLFWLISGWLSVNPNQWFNGRGFDGAALQRYAGHNAASFPAPAWQAIRQGDGAREIRMNWVGGAPVLLVASGEGSIQALDPRSGLPLQWDRGALIRSAATLLPTASIASSEVQTEPDAYWYSHHNTRQLPVLRVRFDDTDHTWAYIHPTTGQVIGRSDDSRRAYRWLFNAVHSYDFVTLTQHRPWWDAVMWALSIVGLVMSVSGVVVGWRRLRR
ncbi:PepSY domain-containing protein [Cupriavidus sp. RAF12]|uniref:PepSY domain-containing protein n=1 Tax=Cupriavidus sp. RAF12 TaxID=3233050 RepID=UPI003F8F017D